MPPKKAPSESKQGLVITLVFFILMTLGLGVATYYGFAEQETLTKNARKAKDDEALFKAERDYYLAQANFFRIMMGYPLQPDYDADRLALDKGKIEQGTLGKGVKSQEDVKKLLGDLDKEVGWDPAGKKAKTSWKDQLAKAQADYAALLDRNAKLVQAVAAAEKKAREFEVLQKDAADKYEKDLLALQKKLQGDMGNDRKMIDTLRNDIVELGKKKEEDLKKLADQLKLATAEVAKKGKEIDKWKKLVKLREDQLAELNKGKDTETPQAAIRTDWRILRMDERGTKPYINLGSADRVQPQLSFSIHGKGLDGRPNPTPKGALEVVNVLGDHLSQARITSVNDPNRDPILQGDYLYNPLWDPFLKKHVAVAGIVDLWGGARDLESSLQDFLRSLERMNVVVDAWMDPREKWKIKGPGITPKTDYLILGENPDLSKDVAIGINTLKDQAKENHVVVLGLRKYLEMIGYRLPPHLQEPTGISPLYKPRPDNLERLPPERQPVVKPPAGAAK
jgi:hypothetical protein